MNLDRVEKYTPEMLSVVRIIIALLFLEHGSAKLLGFPPPPHGEPAVMTLMWIQGLIELAGGALLAIGLFTRPVAFILSGNMAVAYFMAHAAKGFFPLLNGGDSAILYSFIFLLFFVAGPGRWSLDAELTQDYRSGDYRGDHRARGDHYGERTAQAARGR
jgi:putative oxidoreductase